MITIILVADTLNRYKQLVSFMRTLPFNSSQSIGSEYRFLDLIRVIPRPNMDNVQQVDRYTCGLSGDMIIYFKEPFEYQKQRVQQSLYRSKHKLEFLVTEEGLVKY